MMMRLVSFFVLSIAVHAGALVYPISFGGKAPTELLQVTILPLQPEGLGGIDTGRRGTPGPAHGSKPVVRRAATVLSQAKLQSNTDPEPQSVQHELPIQHEPPGTRVEAGVLLASTTPNSDESPAAAVFSSAGNEASAPSAAPGKGGSGGKGSGSSGAGPGAGIGQGASENRVGLTEARYRDTPKPNYPDSARREGREGRVLLRVLVDDQGRSKQVEINSSSGSETLDRAAAETIKRWRFYPARYGDQPVESWLRIPVEFRLADGKSR